MRSVKQIEPRAGLQLLPAKVKNNHSHQWPGFCLALAQNSVQAGDGGGPPQSEVDAGKPASQPVFWIGSCGGRGGPETKRLAVLRQCKKTVRELLLSPLGVNCSMDAAGQKSP